MAAADHRGLVPADERAGEADARIGTEADGCVHRVHERRPAIGVDGVVAGVGGDGDRARTDALGESGGDGQQDAVAERHHGAAHRAIGVMAVRDLAARHQEIGGQQPAEAAQIHHLVADAEGGGLRPRQRQLAVVVLGPVVEAQCGGDPARRVLVVEQGGGIHPAAQQNHRAHEKRNARQAIADQPGAWLSCLKLLGRGHRVRSGGRGSLGLLAGRTDRGGDDNEEKDDVLHRPLP